MIIATQTKEENHAALVDRGRVYELLCVELLAKHEIIATRANEFDIRSHDLDVWSQNGRSVRVEVKGSQLRDMGNNHRGWQFLIHRAGKGAHAPSDVTVLLCMGKEEKILGLFAIPTREITTNIIGIYGIDPANSRGKWSKYLWNFQIILDMLRDADEEIEKNKTGAAQ